MTGMRIDSVWDLLVARITALEERMEQYEARLEYALEDATMDGIVAALDEEDPDDFWLGGTDGPDD